MQLSTVHQTNALTNKPEASAQTSQTTVSNRLKESMEGFKKGPWSKEEDAKLLDWVAVNGPHNWSSIQSKGLLMRTGKSCRLRWVNKLRPGLKKGRKFSPAEEEMVVKLQAELGNKWARIAQFFPGRTDNDVKNFWSTRKKRLARNRRDPLLSVSGNETGMHLSELVVPPDEAHIYEQQDEAITFNQTIGLPYINRFLNATLATPVLTVPTSNLSQTKSSSAPFNNVMPCQQCLNSTSGTPVLTFHTSNLPNKEREPSSAPFQSVVPHQQCLNGTSGTPVLTFPSSNLTNTEREPSSTPFHSVVPHQQCLNDTSATSVLTLPTSSNTPNTKRGQQPAPFDNVIPYQHCEKGTSAIPVLTVPPPDVPSMKTVPSSAPFNNLSPPIQCPFWDRLFETELIFLEPECSFLGGSGACRTPPAFDDLTADVLDSFDRPHLPGAKV